MPKRSLKESIDTFVSYLAFFGFAALVALAIYWLVGHRSAVKPGSDTPEAPGEIAAPGSTASPAGVPIQSLKPSAHLKPVMEANLPPLLGPLDGKATYPTAALAALETTIAARREIRNAWQPAWETAGRLCQTIREGYARRAGLTSKLSTVAKPAHPAGTLKVAPLDPAGQKKRDAFFDDTSRRQWTDDATQIRATIEQLYLEILATETKASRETASRP